ncbi:glycosyltransferase family 2 protein [Candidatus Bathyarchaeota archaeon]|nr:glycosyltransferase family 2 protein [Candidatus Bathyarchaeota archaeon]
MRDPLISIIIVSYNNPQILKQTLDSIYSNLCETDFELVVVDNCSKETNVSMIRNSYTKVVLIENDSNRGFAAGCNIGAKISRGKYLLFVNSDIIFRKNPLPKILDYLSNNHQTGIVGGQLLNLDESLQPSFFKFPSLLMRFLQITNFKSLIKKMLPTKQLPNETFIEVDYVSGAFLLIQKDLFVKLNGFDENYFMYHEDADLCFQAKKNGKKVTAYISTDIIHLGENYEYSLNYFSIYHLNRGQIFFYKKNYSKLNYYILLIMSISVFTVKYLLTFLLREAISSRPVVASLIKLYSQSIIKKVP